MNQHPNQLNQTMGSGSPKHSGVWERNENVSCQSLDRENEGNYNCLKCYQSEMHECTNVAQLKTPIDYNNEKSLEIVHWKMGALI